MVLVTSELVVIMLRVQLSYTSQTIFVHARLSCLLCTCHTYILIKPNMFAYNLITTQLINLQFECDGLCFHHITPHHLDSNDLALLVQAKDVQAPAAIHLAYDKHPERFQPVVP